MYFCREAAVHPRGGGHETAKPNRDQVDTRLGFDKKKLPTGVQKLGSGLLRLGFAVFYPNLRSLTSPRFFDFVRLRGNRARSTKPSVGTAKPKPILLGFSVLRLGLDVIILGFGALMPFLRSPADPFAGLQRFSAFTPKPNKIVLNAPRPGPRFCIR